MRASAHLKNTGPPASGRSGGAASAARNGAALLALCIRRTGVSGWAAAAGEEFPLPVQGAYARLPRSCRGIACTSQPWSSRPAPGFGLSGFIFCDTRDYHQRYSYDIQGYLARMHLPALEIDACAQVSSTGISHQWNCLPSSFLKSIKCEAFATHVPSSPASRHLRRAVGVNLCACASKQTYRYNYMIQCTAVKPATSSPGALGCQQTIACACKVPYHLKRK